MLDEHSWALAVRAVDVAVRPAILTRYWSPCRPELRPGNPLRTRREPEPRLRVQTGAGRGSRWERQRHKLRAGAGY